MNFDIKKRFILFLNKLPYIRELHRKANLMYFPPGHYYSPIADIDQNKTAGTRNMASNLDGEY